MGVKQYRYGKLAVFRIEIVLDAYYGARYGFIEDCWIGSGPRSRNKEKIECIKL